MAFDHQQRLVELAAGVLVEADVLHIVERIRYYDPNLRIKYLDPDSGGEFDDPPYKIMELCPDGFERLVFGVWCLDERVLDRLYAADTQHHDILLRLDGTNAKAKADMQRRYEEEQEEIQDKVVHTLRSPKSTYTLPGPEGTKIVMSGDLPSKVVTKSGTEVNIHQVTE